MRNLEVAKWLLEIKPDIDITESFNQACSSGNLEVVKWLHEIKPDIDITESFKRACSSGCLEVVKWLLEIKPDIDITDYKHAYNLHQHRVINCLRKIKPDIIDFSSDYDFTIDYDYYSEILQRILFK
jgi:hypothetical protein